MTSKLWSAGALALVTALASWAVPGVGHAVEAIVTGERVVPATELGQDVVVRNVRVHDGLVSGTVVNRSGKVLRDVKLVIRHLWLWNNEFHPGTDDPSRVDYYTLHNEVPPAGQVDFSYRLSSPLPEGPGGRFDTQVQVASVVEVTPGAGTGGPSPTSGTRAIPPDE
jgi:hypothetical protein